MNWVGRDGCWGECSISFSGVVFFFFQADFFFQAEDGIRGLVRSRGLGDVYKGQIKDYDLISFDSFPSWNS